MRVGAVCNGFTHSDTVLRAPSTIIAGRLAPACRGAYPDDPAGYTSLPPPEPTPVAGGRHADRH
ncbi:hypothetical protein SAMN05216532_6107 [Streptomyces sp. 2231.1]|nr:hypothetical protein SAMN05216532_6107 [Streptomyces sp. 2231.1]